jgi:hypothetical protein
MIMGDELVPATGGNLPAPATGGNLPATLGGGITPFAGNGASREAVRPAGGAVAQNLARWSWLDELDQELRRLNDDLTRIGDRLDMLARSAEVLDQLVTNIDDLSKFYEAPAATRSATDAADTVASLIVELVRTTRGHAHTTQVCNAKAFLGLRVMNEAQDSQRNMGAGPRLLQTAGRRG